MFCTVDENFTAYGLLDHRHTPEIEQEIGAQVLFTPHLAPLNRGILATCYARPAAARRRRRQSLLDLLRDRYAGEPFVVVTDGVAVDQGDAGHNAVHVTARYDERTEHGDRDLRDRQPGQGCQRRRSAGGQRRARPRPRPPASPASGCTRDRDRRRRGRADGRPRPRRGAAVHPSLRRPGRRREVRRQRAGRHVARTTRWRCSPRTSC